MLRRITKLLTRRTPVTTNIGDMNIDKLLNAKEHNKFNDFSTNTNSGTNKIYNETEEIMNKLRLMEQHQNSNDKRFDVLEYLKNLRFPILLAAGSLLTYYLWNSMPFPIISKHLSLNEYTIQKGYWHTIFTSAVSFKTEGQIFTYMPGMVFSLAMLARRLRTRHFMATFALNSIVCGLSAIMYEKNYSLSHDKLMIPKIGGCYTALMYMSLFATVAPNYGFMGTRFLPFWFIPVMFAFYEYQELKETIVHEISRPSHLIGLFNGVIFGLFIRKYAKLLKL